MLEFQLLLGVMLRPKDVVDLDADRAAATTSGLALTPIHPQSPLRRQPPRASTSAGSEARAEAVPDVVAAEAVSVTSSAGGASSMYLGCGSATSSSAVQSAVMSCASLSASSSE